MRRIGTPRSRPFSDFSSSGSSSESSFIHAFVVTSTNSVPVAVIDFGVVTAAICGPTKPGHSGMTAACSTRAASPLDPSQFATMLPIASGFFFRSVMPL